MKNQMKNRNEVMESRKKKSPRGSAAGGHGAVKNRRRRKIIVWCAAVLGTLVLLALIGAWLTFSGYRDYSAPQLGEKHYLLLRRIATDLRKNRELDEAELQFTPEEMGLLLDIVRHSSQFVPTREKLPPPESFLLQYDKFGGFRGVGPVPVAGKWCFGGMIYVSGVLYLEKRGDKVEAEVENIRFGRFDLPFPISVDTLVPGWRDRLADEFSRGYMKAIKTIRAKRDGSFVLIYRPQELRKPLKKQLTKLRENCSGELKVPLTELIKAL